MQRTSILVCLGLSLAVTLVIPAALFGQEVATGSVRQGTVPANAQGKKLNLDFESGTLDDWHTEGNAFADQPIAGDTVHP